MLGKTEKVAATREGYLSNRTDMEGTSSLSNFADEQFTRGVKLRYDIGHLGSMGVA